LVIFTECHILGVNTLEVNKMDTATANALIKAAYAEGVKQALTERGLDEKTASIRSEVFTEEKFAGIADVGQAIRSGLGRAGQAVGGAASRAGQAVGGAASRAGQAVGGAARSAKETASIPIENLKLLRETNPEAFNALMGGGIIGGGAGLGAGIGGTLGTQALLED